MKKTVAIMAGLALTGSMASLAQDQETQDYDPNRDIVTDTEQDRTTGMGQTQQDSATQSEYGTEQETQTEMGTDPYGTESQTQTTDPYGTETETQTQSDPYGTETQTETETETYGAETGGEMSQDVTAMTSEELQGKTIVTETGEEIGSVNEVGYSSTHQERVATVEVGGFLGVGQKTIAVPLSDLQSGQEQNQLKTSMTRESIESQQEFDASQLSTDQQQQ